MKALLVLAVPASAPRVDDLVSAADGAILVGEAVPRGLSVSRVIASVREPRQTPIEVLVSLPAPAPERWSKQRIAATAGIALTLIIAIAGVWLAYRPLARGGFTTRGPKPDTTQGLKVISAVPDTAIRFSPGSGVAVATSVVPRITNPGDSAVASAFAVELMSHNTQAGAILNVRQDGKNLPAVTFAPVLVEGGKRWFRVFVGAYANRASADSLLEELRKRKRLQNDAGVVARLPFAFLIESGVRPEAVPGMVAQYADGGQPVYALRQVDGTAWLLLGAFDSPEQSSLYAASLPSGIAPVLVYRKGRTF